MSSRRRWIRWAAIAVAAALAILILRTPIRRALGHALVVQDPLPSQVDLIAVTVETGAAGLLETADLVHAGVGSRVMVFAEEEDAADRELVRRGLARGNPKATWKLRLLRSLGVSAEIISEGVSGTHTESEILPAWCAAHQVRTVVVVTTADHSRRMRRMMRRAMAPRRIEVAVRPSRYSSFDADTWWTTWTGERTGLIELQKLILDLLQHPIP